MPKLESLSRTTLLVGGGLLALLLAWRVLVAGADAMRQRAEALDYRSMLTTFAGADAPWRDRLSRDPADRRALLGLALELERRGQQAEAAKAMHDLLRLAPSDPQTLLPVAAFFFKTGDDAAGLAALRRVLDSGPVRVGQGQAFGAGILPTMTRGLESGRHHVFFDAIARENPPWWPAFFEHLCANANAGLVQALFQSRVEAKVATPEERRCIVGRLQRDGAWSDAYVLWLNGLPLEQRQNVGYVYNGTFEWPLTNSGFDWLVSGQEGAFVTTEAGQAAGAGRLLSVTFDNKRQAAPPVRQFLLLAPGRYVFQGDTRVDLESWVGLQWGIHCVEPAGKPARQIARIGRFVGAADWRSFAEQFEVPKDCPAQELRLEPGSPRREAPSANAAVTRFKGRIWFGELKVRIADEPAGR